ncbi:ABC transporter permease [Candidatus Binatia bacterium]|nr:ABC transporter permease [Candidatus Binatia bacterium]
MRYEFLIGLRYLRAKRTETFISLNTVFSVLGVTAGVMTLNIVLAVMTGFEEDLRDRILGFNPHVAIHGDGGRVPLAAAAVEKVRALPGVVAVAPVVEGQAMLAAERSVTGAKVVGLPPDFDVLDIESRLSAGRLADLERLHEVALENGHEGAVELGGIVLAKEVTRQLGVGVGDPVTLISPVTKPTAIGMIPRVKRFVVVGVFDSGMAEPLAFMHLPDAQRFFDLDRDVSDIEVRVRDAEAADAVAAAIRTALPPGVRVRDWMESNRSLFSALRLEKTVYFIVLLLIVVVAAFNIVTTLIMVVMEKRKDIAVLKSMGATAAGVARIFVFKGMLVGMAGTLCGNLLGFAACWLLGRYELVELPKDVFYVNTLPVVMHVEYFVAVTVAALAISVAATLYPARQAARLVPVDVIRYE